MLDYSFNKFDINYSLHFVCQYLFGGRLKKNRNWIYKSKDSMGNINNSFKIFRNKPYIIIFHS